MPLEGKYNIYTARPDALQFIDDGILHYAAKGKPCKRYGGRIDDPYWKYLVQTLGVRAEISWYVMSDPLLILCSVSRFFLYIIIIRMVWDILLLQ